MSASIGFLSPHSHRHGPISVREAQPADTPAMEDVLRRSPRAYTSLGGTMHKAISDDLALTAWQVGTLAGFIIAHQQGPAAAWIHACGIANDVATSEVGPPLVRVLEQGARRAGIDWIGYMDEYNLRWLRDLLKETGFQRHTRVVGYEAPLKNPPDRGNTSVQVRPATREDISDIAHIDQLAFEALWAYREQLFANVLEQAACFLVCERVGQIQGYIMVTQHGQDHVHVVRLAVDPARQGQGLGTRLLSEAFLFFQARGTRSISLNTQEENFNSQRLYHLFGFRPTREGTHVWAKELRVGKLGNGEGRRWRIK